jgi:hypothetical protein
LLSWPLAISSTPGEPASSWRGSHRWACGGRSVRLLGGRPHGSVNGQRTGWFGVALAHGYPSRTASTTSTGTPSASRTRTVAPSPSFAPVRRHWLASTGAPRLCRNRRDRNPSVVAAFSCSSAMAPGPTLSSSPATYRVAPIAITAALLLAVLGFLRIRVLRLQRRRSRLTRGRSGPYSRAPA